MRYRILFSITLILTLMIFALLFFTFKIVRTNYANYDGEYIKSTTSNHYYRVTDIDFGDAFYRVYQAVVFYNSIHILYYNDNLDCLKLARSNSLNPKSHKDWEITTVVTSVTNSFKGLNQKTNLKNSEDRYIQSVSYSMVAGKPCIAYSLISTKETEPCYLVVLQAKTSNPQNSDDWQYNCKNITNFNFVISSQSCYSSGQFIFLLSVTNDGNQKMNAMKYDKLVLCAFDPLNNKWDSRILLKRNPNENKALSAFLIPHPNMFIINYIQWNLNNQIDPIPIYLLAIPNGLSSDKSTWIKSHVISKHLGIEYGLRINTGIYNIATSTVYQITSLKNSEYLGMSYKIKNGKPTDIKEYLVKRTPLKSLQSYIRYIDILGSFNILQTDNKLKSLFVTNGVLQLRNFEIDFKPNNAKFEYINIFRKPLAEPTGKIEPCVIEDGISFVYQQKRSNKLRFAREVDPKDIPKNWFRNLFLISNQKIQ